MRVLPFTPPLIDYRRVPSFFCFASGLSLLSRWLVAGGEGIHVSFFRRQVRISPIFEEDLEV